MKRFKILFFLFAASGAAWADDERAARIVTLRGQVSVVRGSANKISVRVGDSVFRKDILKTGTNSALKLLFVDRTIIDLGSDTELKINEFLLKKTKNRKVDIELSSGKMRTSVNEPVGDQGDFKVKTKSVVMGVRGTEFVVESMDSPGTPTSGTAQITVLEGSVSVGSTASSGSGSTPGTSTSGPSSGMGSSISLSAGQQLNSANAFTSTGGASPGSAPVQNLSASQTSQISQTATVSDTSFQATVNMEAPASGSGGSGSVGSSSAPGGPEKSSAGAPQAARTPSAAIATVVQTVSQAVAAAPPPPIDLGQMRLPGSATDTQSAPPPPQTTNLLIGAPASLTVTFSP